jgi:hypothetical protein
VRRYLLLLLLLSASLPQLRASVLGQVSGTLRDPQGRVVAAATITLTNPSIGLNRTVTTGPNGRFRFLAVPFGSLSVQVSAQGFAPFTEELNLLPDTAPSLSITLALPSVRQAVEARSVVSDSVTPTTLISRREIEQTPGASLTDSLAMITDYVPGAYMTHDMLHMRGGHQVDWLIDGVQIPNTNIASNLGPQIDPNDIAWMDVSRGSYAASMGDRTYGIFNVEPRSGFSSHRDAELSMMAGSALSTDESLSVADHTRRFAYYASANGNRSDYGLAPPIEQADHDATNGYGGFTNLQFDQSAENRFQFVGQLRRDFFQIPYDPNQNDYENQLYDSSGLRDSQHETDGLAALTWTHTFGDAGVTEISPFYHYNSADYQPGAGDTPVGTTSDRSSNYAGLQAQGTLAVARNYLSAGFYAWGQHDSNVFGTVTPADPAQNFSIASIAAAGLVEEYASDSYRPNRWVTVDGGLRQSWFRGDFTEKETSPRVGLALRVPKLNWVFRGFYGRFYQPPPLVSATGPLIGYAQANNTSFAPLHGERDEEHQFGVQIPLPGKLHGWIVDADTFKTRANNFLDHSNIGESSIYFPVTVDGALIQAWELTLHTPILPREGHAYLTYSNQIAQQRGAITGGLVCYPISSPQCDVDPGYEALDHDQRNTLNLGGDALLFQRIRASTAVHYGSGFSNGFPGPPSPYDGDYLPEHTTFDLTLARDFGESLTAKVTALNVANRRVLLDNSLTFGGFHENDPRQIFGEVRYRFHF